MKQQRVLRSLVAIAVGGSTLFSPGCGDLVRRSLRDGTLALVAGSAAGYFDPNDFSNLLTNLLTGGFTGGWGGVIGGWTPSPFDLPRS